MLRALVERLWLSQDAGAGWPIRVTSGVVPEGHRVVERYAVVPGPAHPRFLVPLAGNAVAAGSLTHYNGLRWARLRLPRTVLGAGFRTGVAQTLLRHRLLVCAPTALPDAELGDYLLSAHLQRVLEVPRPALGIGVHAADPNLKPTLQLFGPDGAPVGYAKIGWNAATREMTRREAAAVAAAAGEAGNRIRVPRLLHEGPWRDHHLTVTAPLPLKIRRFRDADAPPLVSRDGGFFATGTAKLADSDFWRALGDEIAVLRSDADERRLAALVAACRDDLERDHGDTPLPVGRWHGDWVPWNMGRHGGELHVWDWEHSAPGVPVGFDHLHWRFQVALVLRGRPLADAVAAVRTAAAGELTDVRSEHRALVANLYLLEMFMRTYHLKRLGGGWNPALYPAMLDVLEGM